ncbi:DNA helicase MCM9 [Eumeta japonica]|uniref:DNA helicase MCM9 n=1 Tax=Eumeta variegata TaxID=151549 RepID=A0A4C1T0R7_EUMVA|nr:DNA helicase MCM9 [Eumeta japonica]
MKGLTSELKGSLKKKIVGNGIVRRRWRPCTQTKKTEVELVLQGNHVEVCNSQKSKVTTAAPDVKECFDHYWTKFENCPMKGRDQILMSICPQVYGLHVVKLALLLTIITGSNYMEEEDLPKKKSEEEYKTKIRGQCHLLLVGDPGTGKSQLLRAGAELTPRSVFTSGTGSTKAGLTCSALREEGEWQLEAGALVLADGGACCVDEFSRLREHDRASVHEAMEQQTISIAKAGIVCKLNTRCAIIAACNPKGNYDTSQPLSVNVSIGTPLLSRCLRVPFFLERVAIGTLYAAAAFLKDKPVSIAFNAFAKSPESNLYAQMYISLIGPRVTKMTKSANTILQSYYMKQRMSAHRDPSRTTVRMLDSLVRLSQAHCRLMYRNIILPVDAITAVSLVDLSMQDCTLKDTMDALHSTFPKHPDYNYLLKAKTLLTKLNLDKIWKEELLYYAKILQVDHKTLDSDLDKNNERIFLKFDDVTDDNIPLSCSVVTSSYFKKNDDSNNSNKNGETSVAKEAVNEKLVTAQVAEELHTIETKLKSDFKTNKRKREDSVIAKTIDLKKVKFSNKGKRTSDSDINEDSTSANLLKAVPSVNDELNELQVKLELDKEDNDIDISNSNTDGYQANKDFMNQSNSEKDSCIPKKCEPSMSRVSKLKQFQFIQKHDPNKYTDIPQKINDKVVNLKIESENSNLNENVHIQNIGRNNSQISIFESSNCDIDIDL